MSPRFMPISQTRMPRRPARCRAPRPQAIGRDSPATASARTACGDRGQRRRREAESRDRVARHIGKAAREHRIDRPREGRHEGRRKSGQIAPVNVMPRPANSRAVPAERDQRARDVMHAQAFARQQRGEQHDQHRPEIADKLRLGRRRKPQRQEIERVIAEQPADTERPHRPWLLQRARRARPEQPRRGTDPATDGECHRGELKRRHGAGCHGQQREQRPHQDRREADEGGCG